MRLKKRKVDWGSSPALFGALCLVFLAAFMGTCSRAYLIPLLKGGDKLAKHMVWYSLVSKSAQAFILLPLYHMFNEVADDKQRFYGRAKDGCFVSMLAYFILSAVIMKFTGSLVTAVGGTEKYVEANLFLRLEEIADIVGFGGNFVVVFLTVAGKGKYIAEMAIIRMAMSSVGTVTLAKAIGINGIAYADIVSGALLLLFCLLHLRKWDYDADSPGEGWQWMLEWGGIGIFSGMQTVFSNIVFYGICIRLLMNMEREGGFLAAVAFVWGFLMIPVKAYAELIRREPISKEECQKHMQMSSALFLLSLGTIPLWKSLIRVSFSMSAPAADYVINLLFLMLPFMVAYVVQEVFRSRMIAEGLSPAMAVAAMCSNGLYILIGLTLERVGVFYMSFQFVFMLFGGIFVVGALAYGAMYYWSLKWIRSQEVEEAIEGSKNDNMEWI